jgi:CTP synthase
MKQKIALFTNVEQDAVITAKDVESIYEVPLVLHKEGLDGKIVEKLEMWTAEPKLDRWESILQVVRNPREEVTIAMVGKYVDRPTPTRAERGPRPRRIPPRARVIIRHVDSEDWRRRRRCPSALRDADGILVPGGFGGRGVEGKCAAIRYAREHKVPYLGICYGMHWAVVEFGRNVCGLAGANTTECDPDTPHPVIALMPDQVNVDKYGGTMRLGSYPAVLQDGTLANLAYKSREISERHRHRYELNNLYRERLGMHGMIFSGVSPDGRLVEIVELRDHPWFLGCQFHPEFKSRPLRAAPLFVSYVAAALGCAARGGHRRTEATGLRIHAQAKSHTEPVAPGRPAPQGARGLGGHPDRPPGARHRGRRRGRPWRARG